MPNKQIKHHSFRYLLSSNDIDLFHDLFSQGVDFQSVGLFVVIMEVKSISVFLKLEDLLQVQTINYLRHVNVKLPLISFRLESLVLHD